MIKNIERKSHRSHHIYSNQDNLLEDFVVTNMTKIVIAYQRIHLNSPIRRLTSKVAWLRSVEGIIKLVLSQASSCDKVLDIGCGIGHLSALLSMMGRDVIGIDLNPDKQLWMNLSKKAKCQFICADARYLPFKSEEFNVGVAYAVLEHVGSEDGECRFLTETSRILAKRGRFVMGGVPSELAFTETFWGHERKYNQKSILGLLESSMLYPIYVENEYLLPQYLPMDFLDGVWNLLAPLIVRVDKILRILPLYHSNFIISEKSSRTKINHKIGQKEVFG